MKELIIVIGCVAIIAVIAFVMFRGAKRIHKEYKVQPKTQYPKKIPIQAIQAGLGLAWAAIIYDLTNRRGIGYEIAVPAVTAAVLVLYYVMKKGSIELNAKQKAKKND